MKNKFYVTTTIPYANAPPHIGHALEFVQADVLARWNRLKDKKVFFLSGTDEHGSKNYRTALKQGITPKKFVDKNAGYFVELLKKLNISNDNFIQTSDKKKHWPGVIDVWKKLDKKGDIYKKKYVGKYCSGCERYLTEKDLVDGKCENHPNIGIEELTEENYFFKLSKYSNKIIDLIKKDKLRIFPIQWKNDFLGLIKDGLQDVSFSRETRFLPWGIPVPGDNNQVMYVWCDALTNYLTGIGYPNKKFEKYWPADIHVVGKDMLRFHAGIWPGMLLSAGIELPKEIIVHGFLTINGKKMSKSLGNVVAPLELLKKYSADTLRYFLLRATPFGDDGDFSEKTLIDRHNNELANKLGNLVSRVAGLIAPRAYPETSPAEKPTRGKKNGVDKEGNDLIKKLDERKINKLFENYEFDKVLNEIFAFIDLCNEYVQKNKLWETKDKKKLFELKESILKIADLLLPFIPESAEKIKKQFSAIKIKKGEILFEKIK